MWRLASEGGLVAAPEIIWWRLEHPPHGLRERNAVQVYIEAAGLECQGRLLASDDVTAYVSAVAAQRKTGEIVVFVTGDAPMKQVVGGLDRLRKVPVPQITVHYRTHQPGVQILTGCWQERLSRAFDIGKTPDFLNDSLTDARPHLCQCHRVARCCDPGLSTGGLGA